MVSNRETVFEPTKINARVNYRMSTGFFVLHDVKGYRMFDIINVLDSISAEPKAHKISAWFEKNLTQEEASTSPLAGVQADEFSLLTGVRVDDAITPRIVENYR